MWAWLRTLICRAFRRRPPDELYLRGQYAGLQQHHRSVASMAAGEKWYADRADSAERDLRMWRRRLAALSPEERELRLQVESVVRLLKGSLSRAEAGLKWAARKVRRAEDRLDAATARLRAERQAASVYGDVSWMDLDPDERLIQAEAERKLESTLPEPYDDEGRAFLEALFIRREGRGATRTVDEASSEPSSVEEEALEPRESRLVS